MELIYEVGTDGTITGLYNDFLSTIDGKKEINRASNVEFDPEADGWLVKVEIGKWAGCFLPKVFNKRKEAIQAEIQFFNETLFERN